MVNNDVFMWGFWLLVLAIGIDLIVLRLQFRQIKDNKLLTRLKWLLFGSVAFLVLASLPLAVVYADAVWLHKGGNWLIYLAVLGNASSKVMIGLLLYLIYRYNGEQ